MPTLVILNLGILSVLDFSGAFFCSEIFMYVTSCLWPQPDHDMVSW